MEVAGLIFERTLEPAATADRRSTLCLERRGHPRPELHHMDLQQRVYQRILLSSVLPDQSANAFLRETTAEKLSSRESARPTRIRSKPFVPKPDFIGTRLLLSLDMFRNVPFVNEDSPVGSTLPPQIKAVDLFDYIEKELTECEAECSIPLLDMTQPITGVHTKLPTGRSCHVSLP